MGGGINKTDPPNSKVSAKVWLGFQVVIPGGRLQLGIYQERFVNFSIPLKADDGITSRGTGAGAKTLVYIMKEEVGRLTEQRALDTLTEKLESSEIEGNDKEQITSLPIPSNSDDCDDTSRRLIDLDLIFDDETDGGCC